LYVGSSFNLGDRFGKCYFSFTYLTNQPPAVVVFAVFMKYGYSNFYVTILEYCPKDKVFLHSRETYWIAFFNTFYNIRRIGGSGIGHIHTYLFLIKKSLATTGNLNLMFGVRLFGPLNPFFGKIHFEETKQIISKANSGFNHLFLVRFIQKKLN